MTDTSSTYRINNLASLYALLRFVAPLFASRAALADEQSTLRYSELLANVNQIASALRARGVGPGSRVAVIAHKSIALVETLIAVNACNAAFVPINPQLKPAQVEHILRDSNAGIVVATRYRLSSLDESRPVACQGVALEDLVAEPAAVDAPVLSACDGDPAAILYTSGSTGLPKGVVLTQRNLLSGAFSIADYLGLAPHDVVLGVLPLSFDAGLSQLTTAIAAGACYVPYEFMAANQLPRVCQKLGVTTITAVPPLWHLISEATWGDEALGVRRIANTGGHMAPELLSRLRQCFPAARPFLMYGLTESFRSTYLDPAQVDTRPGSIGKAVPNAQIAVVRADGTECAADEPGELVHRGAFVTLGYLNDPKRTAERFKPWPHAIPGIERQEMAVWSGDTVRRDAEGYLYFIGRTDEMIKTSGHRVSPTEIETVIGACPGVARVAVIGLPDPRLGQRIVACIVAADDTLADSAVEAHCRARLPNYLVPRHLLRFPEFALNPNGKVDRPRLKLICEERLGAELAAKAGTEVTT
ncbi:AMP-binding protein [Tahibacter amnicola]|uniref:AMP-binding protein n=1 Tax=Tahibacter amnicola TaxID=2976241 RepID=A0ABY6BAL2_9GAMM|nr:AMP-binding protein [Tahibacter amnicola]UXI66193.1 AMP-binding protein [Tahibacter amnicola]